MYIQNINCKYSANNVKLKALAPSIFLLGWWFLFNCFFILVSTAKHSIDTLLNHIEAFQQLIKVGHQNSLYHITSNIFLTVLGKNYGGKF